MQGFVMYRGPSRIDGSPIVVIATGLETGGNNSKTGSMVQVYIMREDISPVAAVHTGDDRSICGDCRHRGKVVTLENGERKNVGRSCYVTLFHGPRVVWDAYRRGVYKEVPIERARKLLGGRKVRLGSYGDPGAVPFWVWEIGLDKVREINGYTHLWREYPHLSAFCMASCDTEAEREEAKALGFRTFRVRSKDSPTLKGEGRCPASHEMGKAVQCAECMLCGGRRTGAKADITIIAHGAGSTHYERQEREKTLA